MHPEHPWSLGLGSVDEEHHNTANDTDLFVALEQLKKVVFKAQKKGQQAILPCTPTASGAKLLIACTALRVCRSGSDAVVKQCCGTWVPVARCFDAQSYDCIDFRALCYVIQSLTRANVRAHEEELLGLEVSQAEKDMALLQCLSSQRSWAAKEPKVTLNSISDADDVPICDPDEAAHRLCQHWGGVFGARSTRIPNDQAQMILSCVQYRQ